MLFTVLNLRADLVFAFVDGDNVVIGRSDPVAFADISEPLAPRWSFWSPNQYLLSWTSAATADPVVVIDDGMVVNATTVTYTRGDMCGAPAATVGWIDPGHIHRAVVSGVRPGSLVRYRFGSVSGPLSEEMSFHVPSDRHARFFVFGDLGTADPDNSSSALWTEPVSLQTTRRVVDDAGGEFVLHIGDLSYALGYLSEWEYVAPLQRYDGR